MDRTNWSKSLATVDVWRDGLSGAWCVSECDWNGEEIRCVAARKTQSKAWDVAKEKAAALHVSARLLGIADEIVEVWEADDGEEVTP